MGFFSSRNNPVLPSVPESSGEDFEYKEFQRLLNEDVSEGNTHGWQIKRKWPEDYKDNFKMRVCLRDHHETGNPNKLLRADGKFRGGVVPEDFLSYLLNPENLPGLQEWVDVETLPDGYIKYCRVKAPLCTARDHCWKYTIDRRENGSIFVCIRTTTHPSRPVVPKVIRGYYYNCSLFQMDPDEPDVMLMTEFIFQDLKGNIPPWLLNMALPVGTIQTNAKEMQYLLDKKKSSNETGQTKGTDLATS